MKFGLDKLLGTPELLSRLKGHRIGLVAHPASVTSDLRHCVDVLVEAGVNLTVAFGPQHGMRGEKQDNMIESGDYMDPDHHIPVYSLYGEHRYPTDEMLDQFDILLFDLQDVGCRIYTFITTLKYFLQACSGTGKSVWILDRPNPAGREIDGLYLLPGHESFVGCDELIMRHGLTVGELAKWMTNKRQFDLDLQVIPIENYNPLLSPGYGWPVTERNWINPSPNAASVNMCRAYGGTVLLEGTTLSEGRGTTTPLEVIGAPNLPVRQLLETMHEIAPNWMRGTILRPCFFEPMFHKHQGSLCHGLQIHADHADYNPAQFKPFRLVALMLKSLRLIDPDYEIWRDHEYEYETGRLPIDVINGGPDLRHWIDDDQAKADDLERRLNHEANRWKAETVPHLLYPC